jgi:hypothetical protein
MNLDELGLSTDPRLTRRNAFRTIACAFAGLAAAFSRSGVAAVDPSPCGDDMPIDTATALLFPAAAPLVPTTGLCDARAVWCRVAGSADKTVLVYFHGHNGYVTVDEKGRSRVPDWASGNETARAGATSKPAAPLVYELDRLDPRRTGKRPVVLVPEVSTLATGSFWAKEPAGQYADPARLGLLVAECVKHLACLHRPDGVPYLTDEFAKAVLPSAPDRPASPRLDRVYLCGHSGAGLPLEEAARSALVLPDTGSPADLWLFDCTYWSKVDGFVAFCERWKQAARLTGGKRAAARFVCIYRPKTQTEEVADELRTAIAKILRVDPASLVKDHSPENFDNEIRPVLKNAGVLFLKTHVPHDTIPTFFIPVLIETSAT